MLLLLSNNYIVPPPGADGGPISPARAAVRLGRFLMPPQSVTPTAGVDGLAFLVPVDEPLSVGAPPRRPSLIARLEFSPQNQGTRIVPDSAGYTTGSPLEAAGGDRPEFDIRWDGRLEERNLIVEFLRGLELATQVGQERSAFDVEPDGPGSGVVKVRPVKPFLDEWVSRDAYRISVRCEQVL